MMKRLFSSSILFTFICFLTIIFGIFYPNIVIAENQTIEVLLDGIDNKPTNIIVGEMNPEINTIELWHHSGGYWSYKGLIINDKDLKYDLTNEDILEQLINEKITFEIPLEQNLYNKLQKTAKLKIYCSSTLTVQKTNKTIPIKDLFYDKPIIELKDNKIYFNAKPKLHFYTKNNITYSEIVGDTFNVDIPIVDPDYGHNSYAIWKRTAKKRFRCNRQLL